MPQVEVTFDIDANGILNVSAKDMATNKEQKITITASTGLSKEEAEKMQKEADSHSPKTSAELAEVEARNRLDHLVYQTEKLIRENREKLGESEVKAAEEAIEEARRALSDGGLDRLNAAAESLTKASHKIAETMYKSQQSAARECIRGPEPVRREREVQAPARQTRCIRRVDRGMSSTPSLSMSTSPRSRTKKRKNEIASGGRILFFFLVE